MKQSQLFTKTIKDAPKGETSKNAQLLIRGGFIKKEMAGVYAFLPLGLRVLNKIIQIIREEMEAIGGQEIKLTALQNKDLWEKSGRWDNEVIDVWFKTKLAAGSEVGLANTHEEPMTSMMTHYITSYKDLPKYVFQFQTKFRNELRARSGITRTREFIMKDLYSFNKDQKGLDEFYEEAKRAYYNIFERVGLGGSTFLTFASGGAFSKYSHEFQVECESGEDTIYLDREKKIAVNDEVYEDKVLSDLGLEKKNLDKIRAIEVGNIFKLGTRFSEAIGLTYLDKKGETQRVVMGSYGIGPARTMGTIVELMNDEKGIVWPESIAPFRAHLIEIKSDTKKVRERVRGVYEKLINAGIEVLWDDRNESVGQKFADSDLIGIPVRLVVSEKTGDNVEWKKRDSDKIELFTVDKVIDFLRSMN